MLGGYICYSLDPMVEAVMVSVKESEMKPARTTALLLALAMTGPFAGMARAAPPVSHGSADARVMANVSTERREVITETGIPAPYFRLANPLPKNLTTLQRGGRIYAQRCSGCHGSIAIPGGGPAGRDLVPHPTDLMALRQLSPRTLDAYMDWTIADGGVSFATAMPGFKSVLSRKDIWSVIYFVRTSVDRQAKH
jgi:mono/diheme cytochrome c family protein